MIRCRRGADLTRSAQSSRKPCGGLLRIDGLDPSKIGAWRSRIESPVTVIDKCDQATKGVWWMSWHLEAMKDVVACDMLRRAGKQALTRRFLNVETQYGDPVLPAGECIAGMELTQGTETSKYLEE